MHPSYDNKFLAGEERHEMKEERVHLLVAVHVGCCEIAAID